MTIYRTWSDMPQLLGDLMTREWGAVVAGTLAAGDPDRPTPSTRAGRRHRRAPSRALRDNELFVRIVELDPELLLPYLLSRRGRCQDALLELIARPRSRRARRDGAIRAGDPDAIARALLLASHGFVLSAHTMVDDDVTRRRPRRRAGRRSSSGCCAMTPTAPADHRPASPTLPTDVDLVVVGLGITGAGVALDAVTRGLSVLAVDAHDLAFGTSRWSSKLVHGGLRYLAQGQVGVAHESAVERGMLMEVTAPHLTRAVPMVLPLSSAVTRRQAAVARRRLLRRRPAAPRGRAPRRETLPAPAPALRDRDAPAGSRPAPGRPARRAASWDGQLEDDARLVTTLARTAAGLRRPRAHPRPGAARDRHRGRRCATS